MGYNGERRTVGVHSRWLREQIEDLAGSLSAVNGPNSEGYTTYHDDTKPNNVLVFRPCNKLKSCDWGSAVMRSVDVAQETPDTDNMSVKPYLPPESTHGRLTPCPHNVRALGCVFLELLV